MNLSVIVPVYQEAKSLERFLTRMTKQTQKKYEIIFVIDTNTSKSLTLVDIYSQSQETQIKIVYNSQRQGRFNAIKKASQIASGKYCVIASTSDIFKDSFIERISVAIEKKQTDIIEFRARTHSPIWFQGFARKAISVTLDKNDSQKRNLFAYSYPFIFNKVIRTRVLMKASQYPCINLQVINSRLSIEIIFKCILFAKTYSFWDEKIVRSKKTTNTNYNPINLLKEWNKLIKSEIFSCYQEELEYNRYFSWKIFYKPYNRYLKKSHLQNRFDSFFEKNTNEGFYDSNTYYLKNNSEAKLLREYKGRDSRRAYKEL